MMIDDIATTGTSVLNGIIQLKAEGLSISNVCVIINRLEGADKKLNSVGVTLHQLTDILEITEILFREKLIGEDILEKIKKQVSQNQAS